MNFKEACEVFKLRDKDIESLKLIHIQDSLINWKKMLKKAESVGYKPTIEQLKKEIKALEVIEAKLKGFKAD
jgi:hypothetical protein